MPSYNVNLNADLEPLPLAALRTAIGEGDASGATEGNSFNRVRQALNIPEARNH